MEIIKSISYDQDEIITNIMKLFNIEQFDIDCTYSSGNFYKNIIQPKFKFDLNPQTKDTIRADCRNLPLKNNNINSSMLDLPFVIGGANFREAKDGSCVIGKRFSSFTSWNQLKELYSNAIKEQYRALKENGILVLKCQDVVVGGLQHLSHIYIINEAIKAGFYPQDIFILLANNRLNSFGGRWKKQFHARKYHCFMIVLQKCKCKVNYDL